MLHGQIWELPLFSLSKRIPRDDLVSVLMYFVGEAPGNWRFFNLGQKGMTAASAERLKLEKLK